MFVQRSWLDMSPETSQYKYLHGLINISAPFEPSCFSADGFGQFTDITPLQLLKVRALLLPLFPFFVNFSMYTFLCANNERVGITIEFFYVNDRCSAAGQPWGVDGMLRWRKVLLRW